MRVPLTALALAGLTLVGCSGGPFAPSDSKARAEYEPSGGGSYEAEATPSEGADSGPLADRGRDLMEIDDQDEPVDMPKGAKKAPRAPSGTAVEPGRSSPLLIYTASLDVAVYQVQATQKKVISMAKAMGGFLARQDGQVVIIRVPALRFEAALDKIESYGDVIRRQIEAKDVTEEFRDQTIRLRNLEVVRARLETLLSKADKVKDALEVQRELARVTGQIELIKGRLRYMEDRIAYSTISVNFQPRPQNDVAGGAPPAFRLPFEWIQELGLQSLMDVR
ncbi:MAG: DUF4349 domain-containing protein [Planctomycetes bacterium]|nr:DUF4349 domain-containing protein [Planctomycetota bacterium]